MLTHYSRSKCNGVRTATHMYHSKVAFELGETEIIIITDTRRLFSLSSFLSRREKILYFFITIISGGIVNGILNMCSTQKSCALFVFIPISSFFSSSSTFSVSSKIVLFPRDLFHISPIFDGPELIGGL